jgi:Protein of unknown function (DUF4058)
MPLRDHFHGELESAFPWPTLHSWWLPVIGRYLNRILPRGRYRTILSVHLGTQVEADVAEFEREIADDEVSTNGATSDGGVAVQTWAPPVATMTWPAVFPDDLEIQIYERNGSGRLVGVVELVSPSNKDRPESRHTFAGKCAAYLKHGIGVVVVDIVTERRANLHNELVQLLDLPEEFLIPPAVELYATSYRPVRRKKVNQIDVWVNPLRLGEPLPIVPFCLLGLQRAIPLDLRTTYEETCQEMGID